MTTPSWDAEIAATTAELPKFKVKHYSDSWFYGFLKKTVLKWAIATTVGYTVFFDDLYYGTDRGVEVIKHERAHVRDWKKWWILLWITYITLLPVVLTMRAFWEWRGYRENLRSVHEQYKNQDPVYYKYILDFYSQWVSGEFCNANYLWMFPFRSVMYKMCQNFYKKLP